MYSKVITISTICFNINGLKYCLLLVRNSGYESPKHLKLTIGSLPLSMYDHFINYCNKIKKIFNLSKQQALLAEIFHTTKMQEKEATIKQ